ncbi:MAG: hypothetical protein AAGE89_17690 [Pseudomonadota bacterium]
MLKQFSRLIALSFIATTLSATSVFADAGSALAAFRDGCIAKAPDYSGAYKTFSDYGFKKPTADQAIFAWDGVGFAGLGHTAKEGSEDEIYASGCLVYLKGTPFIKIATTVNFLVKEKFKFIKTSQHGNDLYWFVDRGNKKPSMVIVSEKSEGKYAGYTLMMITELPK